MGQRLQRDQDAHAGPLARAEAPPTTAAAIGEFSGLGDCWEGPPTLLLRGLGKKDITRPVTGRVPGWVPCRETGRLPPRLPYWEGPTSHPRCCWELPAHYASWSCCEPPPPSPSPARPPLSSLGHLLGAPILSHYCWEPSSPTTCALLPTLCLANGSPPPCYWETLPSCTLSLGAPLIYLLLGDDRDPFHRIDGSPLGLLLGAPPLQPYFWEPHRPTRAFNTAARTVSG